MRILAIEIGDGELRAARALRTFGSARLAGVERIPFADASEDPVIAFEPLAHTDAGTVVLAAAARRADLEASIEPLVAAGLPPARVELAPIAVWSLMPDAAGDAAIVVADGERSALSVRRGGRIVGLRALGTP